MACPNNQQLQGLPDNGKPVRSWSDPDEAWAAVAAGIRRVVGSRSEGSSKSGWG